MPAIFTSSRPFLLLLAWGTTISVTEAVVTDQFIYWYGQFREPFEKIKQGKCAREWNDYRTGDVQSYSADTDVG